MRWAAFAVILAGCNSLLDLDATELANGSGDPGQGKGDQCEPLVWDAGRYHLVNNNNGFGMTWQEARNGFCELLFAADLMVVDAGDDDEMVKGWTLGMTPYWTGISFDGAFWRGVDGCLPQMQWAPGEPTSEQVGDCAIRGETGLISMPCTSTAFNGDPIQAMCETPRPSETCLAIQQPKPPLKYVRPSTGSTVSRDAANASCAGMGLHLVELNSSAELQQVRTQVGGISFWTTAARSNNTFASATGCPQIFNWATGQPVQVSGCVYETTSGMGIGQCDGTVLMEALCESEN